MKVEVLFAPVGSRDQGARSAVLALLGLTVIDAEGAIPEQQKIVRKLITEMIDLDDFKRPYSPRLPLDLAFDEDDRPDEEADL